VAPFLGITPDDPFGLGQKPSDAPNTADPSFSSPLYILHHNLVAVLEQNPNIAKAPHILRDIPTNAWKADKFYRPGQQNLSLFKSVLQKVNQMLDSVRDEWSGSAPENGVMGVDYTNEFYRLWSALLFTCCLPIGEHEHSNLELFGDGLFWAGATIIHFLGQQLRFEVFDFSYHILNVEESASVACNNPSIHQFFKKVSHIRDLNQSIFNTLKTYCPVFPNTLRPPTTTNNNTHNSRNLENIQLMHPPEYDTTDQFISVKGEGKVVTMRGGKVVGTVATHMEHEHPPQ
jgi:cytoplasmic FMR1 interacting protein